MSVAAPVLRTRKIVPQLAICELSAEVVAVFGTPMMIKKRPVGLRAALTVLLCFTMTLVLASSALAATFNPNLVMSDDNMRADNSMTAADIQAFLVYKKSLLATRSFPRHDGGASAPASVIIYEAARAFRISPKVLLVLLQKEQSLITRSASGLVTGDHATLDWAVGMGCPDSGVRYEKYRGFGNQLWYAAHNLSGYGEDGLVVGKFLKSGQYYKPVYPVNLATYKLYAYNPSIGITQPWPDQNTTRSLSGNAAFWVIHWRFFGDPFANPTVMSPTSVSVPRVSSGARHGRTSTFASSLSPSSAAFGGGAKVSLYRLETKTVRKKIKGHWKRVSVRYWRLKSTRTMSRDSDGHLTLKYAPPSSGKWKAVTSFTGSKWYLASHSSTRYFTVK